MSKQDTIIEDLHRIRERMAAEFGGDVQAILADARKRMEESGRPIWSGPQQETSDDAVERVVESG